MGFKEIAFLLAALLLWFVLVRWVFPRMGVGT